MTLAGIRSALQAAIGNTQLADTVQLSSDTEKTKLSATYAAVGNPITVTETVDACRIKFDLKTSSAGDVVSARIYKNGVALGTAQTDTTGAYVTKSEDFASANLVVGDILEIWAKYNANPATAYVRNFRVCFADRIIRTYDVAPAIPSDNAFAYILPIDSKPYVLSTAEERRFEAIVMVQRLPDIEQAQNALDAFLDDSGTKSIWYALENASLGAHGSCVRVLGYKEYSGQQYNGNVFLGVKFDLAVN